MQKFVLVYTIKIVEKYKILVVDDEKDVCESVGNILRERGFSCFFAYDGGGALSCIEKEKPDLILLDIIISGIDGFEVCQRVKHDENFKDIPIIILTCLGDKQSRIAGFKAGADDYLTKPFDPDELIVRIETQLKIKDFTKSLYENIEKLKEQERLKVELLSHVIHDLSVPLQEIEKEVNSLSNYGALNEKQASAIKEISSLCSKMNAILSTFMEIAKADSGKIWINIEEFELDKVISVVEARCKNEAENRGLSLTVACPLKAHIKTDKSRFIKILDEILLTLISFTEKGNISLLVKENPLNDTFIFEVFTEAIISEKYIKRAFDEEIEIGENMRLVLAKKLIGILRGNISVCCDTSGTRFTIVFPKNIESPARRKEDRKN